MVAVSATASVVAAGQSGHPDDADLRVVIAAQDSSLATNLPSGGRVQFVNTVVTNSGTKPQDIVAWTQYGWSWKADSSAVAPGIEALQNVPERFVLGPGKSYSRAVEVFTDGVRPVTFRLGFFPRAEAPLSGRMPAIADSALSWSNAITLGK